MQRVEKQMTRARCGMSGCPYAVSEGPRGDKVTSSTSRAGKSAKPEESNPPGLGSALFHFLSSVPRTDNERTAGH